MCCMRRVPPLHKQGRPKRYCDVGSVASKQVFQILRDLVDQGDKTVVAVTHDLDLARRMDRRILLQDGDIVSDDAQVP